MTLSTAPGGWSARRLAAFNALLEALEAYMVYDYAIGKLGITDVTLVQRRTELGNLITGQLGPAFKAS